MASASTDLTLLSLVASALLYGLLAARLLATGYLARRATAAQRWFLLAAGATTLWAGAGALEVWSGHAAAAAAAMAFDLLRYGAWCAFVLALLAPGLGEGGRTEIRLLRPITAFGLGMATLALVLAWTGAVEDPVGERLQLLSSMALPVLGLVLTEQLFRNIPEDSRWSAKPLCLGLVCLFAFDLYIYSQAALFGAFDLDAFSIRGAVHALAVPPLLVASLRQSDWRAQLQVSHRAGFFSAALLLAGAYLLLVSAIGYYVRYFGGSWGRALQLAVLAAATVLLAALLLSGSVRARLRVFIGKNFFAYRYDYREQWLRFTAALSADGSPQEVGPQVGQRVIRALADLVDSQGGLLWLLATDDGDYEEVAQFNLRPTGGREPSTSPVVELLRRKEWIVDVAEARARPERYDGIELPAWASDPTRTWAVVPLLVGESLTGFVVLAPPRAEMTLDWEVRDLLKTASRQAAVFLAQIQATEALLEARKFDAFNRMSAFVVHDLKNIVAQLSLMMKNARRLHDNPEFQQDMLMTVESSLEKMRQLMLQLREGERPPGSAAGVALRPIARRLAEQALQRGRELELDAPEDVSTRGHDERIERVLGHMVQNAFDATPAEGRVWLKLLRDSGSACVEVGDTGLGMTREFVETRLFRPFSSTKSGGMGIGSYESSQYIRELGGRIDVASEPGRGTVITVRLPLFDTRRGSDLRLAETP